MQYYAQRLGNVPSLLRDLTLPLLSLFSGRSYDEALQRTFSQGAGGPVVRRLPARLSVCLSLVCLCVCACACVRVRACVRVGGVGGEGDGVTLSHVNAM